MPLERVCRRGWAQSLLLGCASIHAGVVPRRVLKPWPARRKGRRQLLHLVTHTARETGPNALRLRGDQPGGLIENYVGSRNCLILPLRLYFKHILQVFMHFNSINDLQKYE